MAHAIFYMHQTSGACAGMRACDRMHQNGEDWFHESLAKGKIV